MNTTVSTYEQQAIDFLAASNTTFTATFKEYGKYFNDDSDSRNVFNCVLENSKHRFAFTFGASIHDSSTEIERRQDEVKDIIDVYAGISFTEYEFSVGISFTITKANDFSLPYEEVEMLADSMQKQYHEKRSNKNKAWRKKFDDGIISRNEMNAKIIGNTPIGTFIQCIQRAIKREREKLVPLNIESSDKIPPSAYDVLAGITKYDPGTFENFCSVYGYDVDSRKAYKTYKSVMREWKNVEKLFTQDEIELLTEIN